MNRFRAGGLAEVSRGDLDKFLKETMASKYSGKGNARVVLFSPIANEKHRGSSDLPDPSEQREYPGYTRRDGEKWRQRTECRLWICSTPQKIFMRKPLRADEALTINGMHLTDEGDASDGGSRSAGIVWTELPMAGRPALTPPGEAHARKNCARP